MKMNQAINKYLTCMGKIIKHLVFIKPHSKRHCGIKNNKYLWMNKIATYSMCLFILMIAQNTLYAQEKQTGVSISTDNYPPHPSAMLDVRSANKGILVPRVDQLPDASTINTADGEGLLFYLTGPPDKKGFYYFKYIEDENKYGWVRLRYSQPRYPKGSIIMYSGDLTDDNGNLMFYNGLDALEQSNADDHFPYLGQGKPGTIMEGWQICNGHNRSPDMTDRFVVGVSDDPDRHSDYTNYKQSDDAKNSDDIDKPKHTWMMDENSMPKHNHFVDPQDFASKKFKHRHKFVNENQHNHHINAGLKDKAGSDYVKYKENKRSSRETQYVNSILASKWVKIDSSDQATFSISGCVDESDEMPTNQNEQGDIENRPPFYKVIFLMRTDRGYPNIEYNEQNYSKKKNPFPKKD